MSQNYEPDSQFVERLEWQLSSEFRRADSLKASSGKVAVSRRIVVVACIIGTFMTGVAMIKAAEYIKDTWRKKIEIARIETDVKLKQARLASQQELLSRIKEQVAQGLVNEEEYYAMNIGVQKAALDLERSMINLDEVKLSGSTPRDELYAPVLRGRDFVSERLGIERSERSLELEYIDRQKNWIEQRVEVGVLPKEELDQIQRVVLESQEKVSEIQDQLDLRIRFNSGEISAREVEVMGRLPVAERTLHQSQANVAHMQQEVKKMEEMEAAGVISGIEVSQMRYALESALAELELAKREVDILNSVK